MEDRTFLISDRITVSDRAGVIGSGKIIGRTYEASPTYDVRLDDGKLLINVQADQVCGDE